MSHLYLECGFSSAGRSRFRDLHVAPVYTLTIALHSLFFLSILTVNTRWTSFATAPRPLEVVTVFSSRPRTWFGDRTMMLRGCRASEMKGQPSLWPRHSTFRDEPCGESANGVFTTSTCLAEEPSPL